MVCFCAFGVLTKQPGFSVIRKTGLVLIQIYVNYLIGFGCLSLSAAAGFQPVVYMPSAFS